MTPTVQAFFDRATFTATYLVSDPATGAAAIIDPVLDYEPKRARLSTESADAVLTAITAQGLDPRWILETHAHADHLSAGDYIRSKTGAKLVIGAHITQVQTLFGGVFEIEAGAGVFDRLIEEGETLPLGDLTVSVLHTPGHTPACVTYLIGDAAFIGDTLFMPDYGTARADFPGGDATALYRSIRRILELPPETRLFTGHDYLPAARETFAWESTVAEQRAANVHVHDGVDEAAFVAMRQARDATLDAPVLILPSLQVNIRGGALPAATPGGHVYLKLPINAL